jgi:hypothetical protein
MKVYKPTKYRIEDGRELLIREAAVADAAVILEHVEHISGESDFLTIGPGEFGLTVEQEEEYLRDSRRSDNKLYIIAWLETTRSSDRLGEGWAHREENQSACANR